MVKFWHIYFTIIEVRMVCATLLGSRGEQGNCVEGPSVELAMQPSC